MNEDNAVAEQCLIDDCAKEATAYSCYCGPHHLKKFGPPVPEPPSTELDLAPIEAQTWTCMKCGKSLPVDYARVICAFCGEGFMVPSLIAEVKRLRADLEIVRAHRDTVVQEVSKENERLRAEVERMKK